MPDFGLLVARFNTGTPVYTADNDLRELRIDSNGRLYTRLADDRDKTIRYFYDGEAVDGGDITLDRGILLLGKNDTDSNYQAIRLNDDGSLVVSFQGGTDVSLHSDATGGTFAPTDTRGEISLTTGTWIKVLEIPVATGTAHLTGWEFLSDKNTLIQVVLSDDTGADGHDRADTTEILSSGLATSAKPCDHYSFSRSKDRAGGTNIALVVWAKQLQSGNAGVATAALEINTTT